MAIKIFKLLFDFLRITKISLQAENEVQTVSDLVSVPSLDVSDLDAEIVRILTSLDDLNNGVNALENKIILAMGIRHKAEKFMKDKIVAYSGTFYWDKGKISGTNI